MPSALSCTYWPFEYFLRGMSAQLFCSFFFLLGYLSFLVLSSRNALHFPESSPLS